MVAANPDFDIIVDEEIFNPVYIPYLDEMARVQIYYGGAASGKSTFVVGQRTVIDILKGGRNYLICREVGKTIRRSVFNEIKRTIQQFGVSELFDINKSEFTITCVNGYQIFFVGLDDVEKIKSIVPEIGVITDIVIEEATETDRNTVKSLMRRQRGGSDDTPKRITLLFNPILQDHWIYEEYFSTIGWADNQTEYRSEDLAILKTWFVHNKFLTEQDRYDLTNETDKYYSDVYTWGNWGVLGNTIFHPYDPEKKTGYEIADLSDLIPKFNNFRNGGDFGFATNPAAISRSHYDKRNKTIYIFEELYETGLTNDELATETIKICGKELIVWDSSEPKSIKELKNYGVNAVEAKKGQDSVLFGLQWLQGCRVVIHKACVNAANEVRQAKWKEDAGGKIVNRNGKPVPVDKNNHFLDATRYAYEEDMLETPKKKARGWNG